MLTQNFGGKTKSIVVFLKVAHGDTSKVGVEIGGDYIKQKAQPEIISPSPVLQSCGNAVALTFHL